MFPTPIGPTPIPNPWMGAAARLKSEAVWKPIFDEIAKGKPPELTPAQAARLAQ